MIMKTLTEKEKKRRNGWNEQDSETYSLFSDFINPSNIYTAYSTENTNTYRINNRTSCIGLLATFKRKKLWHLKNGVSAYFCLSCHHFFPLGLQQSWLISRRVVVSEPYKPPLIPSLPATPNGLPLISKKALTGQQ